jgi:hypothetical protein
VHLSGGVGNAQFGGPTPDPTLTDSVITANRLPARPGIASLGGGLYDLEAATLDPFTTGKPFPVRMTRTVIAGSEPDACAGC